MAAADILDFQICEILLADGFWRAQTITVPYFVKIGRYVAEIAIFRISKIAAAAILHY